MNQKSNESRKQMEWLIQGLSMEQKKARESVTAGIRLKMIY